MYKLERTYLSLGVALKLIKPAAGRGWKLAPFWPHSSVGRELIIRKYVVTAPKIEKNEGCSIARLNSMTPRLVI